MLEPEVNQISFFERTSLQARYSNILNMVPDSPQSLPLLPGDVVHFPYSSTESHRFLVREMANYTTRMKFSGTPPKVDTALEQSSIMNSSYKKR